MNYVISDILKVFGGLLLIFSMVVVFNLDFLEEMPYITNTGEELKMDDIIYFRCILLGSVLILLGSAITTTNMYVSNILYSFSLGVLCVFVSSIENIINDKGINFDLYFNIAMWAIVGSFIIITIIRLWLYKRYKRLSVQRN